VVELHETLRDQKGVVIRQTRDAGTQHDVFGAVGGDTDEDLG
jgi:hypothetical protein